MRALFVTTLALGVLASPQAPAESTDSNAIRATFERFVTAQNAHDLATVATLLLDSPQFLWITRGSPVWGQSEALQRFAKLYAGTWQLAPEWQEFRVVVEQPAVAQLFVPVDFTIGTAGQAPQQARFLMNQTLVKTPAGWRIASILPIPAATPGQ